MITFSNPVLSRTFPDWPMGGSKRGECSFIVEDHNVRGTRFVKQTNTRSKKSTYGGRGAIVEGTDGKVYLIQFAKGHKFIKVLCHDFMAPLPSIHPSGVFPHNEVLYKELATLISLAQTTSIGQEQTQ